MRHEDEAASALLEFLEAAVHTVIQRVYSPSLFENRKLYGVSVRQCRHPGVCSYIGAVLGSLKVNTDAVACAGMVQLLSVHSYTVLLHCSLSC